MAELEDALKKLDRLTEEEARLAFAKVLVGVQHDDIKVDSETVDDTVRSRGEEQGPSSFSSFPIAPPNAVGGRHSSGVRELSVTSVPYEQVTLPCLPLVVCLHH